MEAVVRFWEPSPSLNILRYNLWGRIQYIFVFAIGLPISNSSPFVQMESSDILEILECISSSSSRGQQTDGLISLALVTYTSMCWENSEFKRRLESYPEHNHADTASYCAPMIVMVVYTNSHQIQDSRNTEGRRLLWSVVWG